MLDNNGWTEDDLLLAEVELGVLVDMLLVYAFNVQDGYGNFGRGRSGSEARSDGVDVLQVRDPKCVPRLIGDILEKISINVERAIE